MPESLHVLIVGGGIGGLALAGALAREGAAVDLVEKAPEWRPLGAGIVLGVNAVAVLGALGCGARMDELGHPLTSMATLDSDGKVLLQMDLNTMVGDLGPTYTFHRADLHQLLLEQAQGVNVRLGTSVDQMDDGADGVRVRLTDGTEARYDLVIGADGLRSRVRELVFAEAGASVRYAGYTCWRAVMPNAEGLMGAVEMWGAGLRVGLVPLRDQKLYVFLTENAPAQGQDPVEGRHAWVAAKYQAFGGSARPVLARLASNPELVLMRHDIEDLSQQVWRGQRVGLLGDAGHATTPNLGQGAGMALEDALALVLALRRQPDPAQALRAYEASRAGRVEKIVRMSRQLGAVAQWRNPLAVALNNLAMRAVPTSVSRSSLRAMMEPGLALSRQAAA